MQPKIQFVNSIVCINSNWQYYKVDHIPVLINIYFKEYLFKRSHRPL